jgi:phage regulator Rha-like protein
MATKKESSTAQSPAVVENVENRILFIRGQKVMLDSDLAELYGVLTKNLNKAVKRNLDRFPDDFMFQLTAEEAERLRFQIGTLKRGRGQHRKYLPYVFTEHGAVMLAAVLNSPVAVQASLQVVRAFVRLRSILAAHKDLAKRIDALEKKTDTNFRAVFELIEKYLKPAAKPAQRIGFRADKGQ